MKCLVAPTAPLPQAFRTWCYETWSYFPHRKMTMVRETWGDKGWETDTSSWNNIKEERALGMERRHKEPWAAVPTYREVKKGYMANMWGRTV